MKIVSFRSFLKRSIYLQWAGIISFLSSNIPYERKRLVINHKLPFGENSFVDRNHNHFKMDTMKRKAGKG